MKIKFTPMKIKYFLKTLLFSVILFHLTSTASKAALLGGCDKTFMDLENDVYYLALKVNRDLASDLEWVFTANEGGFDDCKKFFRSNEREVIKKMKGTKGWQSYATLSKRNISKTEFCNSKGPFSTYGMGETALRYCKSNTGSLANLSAYNLCKKSLNLDQSGWVKTNNYVQEAWARGLSIDGCRQAIIKEEGVVTNSNSQAVSDSSPVSKLKELKDLLDEGLISQDQYDQKSEEILDSF